MNYPALGKRVRARRKMLRKTQEEVAQAANISLSFFGNIERGIRIPSLDTLVAIANELSVTLDYLLYESMTTHPERKEAEVRSLLRYLKEKVGELEDNYFFDFEEINLDMNEDKDL